VHPILFHLGPVTIYSYGAMLALGLLAALTMAAIRAKGIGVSKEIVVDFGLWMLISGVIGARLFYVIGHWNEEFAARPLDVIRVDQGGIVFYGGFIAAALTSIWFVRRHKLDYWKFTDAMAPSVALAHAFGRVGCFLNGCCFGTFCPHPWAVHFPPRVLPSGEVVDHDSHGAPVHPTQLYEAAGNLALFAALWWFYPKRKFDGQVFWLYVASYAVWRFVVEFWRGDYGVRFLMGTLKPGQLAAVILLIVAGIFLWKLPRARFGKTTP